MNRIVLVIMIWIAVGCYDDLGNYDCRKINELTVILPEVMEVTVPTEDSVEVDRKSVV